MNIWFLYKLGFIKTVTTNLQTEQKTELEALKEACVELQREIIKRETPKRYTNWE